VLHIAEWIGAVLAAGLISGLVVLAAGAAAVWWLYRTLRRRLQVVTASTARFALQGAVIAAAAGWVRLPPWVVHDLRQRMGGPPDVR
jgi:membrane protein YqaA with SNARE-associated domain